MSFEVHAGSDPYFDPLFERSPDVFGVAYNQKMAEFHFLSDLLLSFELHTSLDPYFYSLFERYLYTFASEGGLHVTPCL